MHWTQALANMQGYTARLTSGENAASLAKDITDYIEALEKSAATSTPPVTFRGEPVQGGWLFGMCAASRSEVAFVKHLCQIRALQVELLEGEEVIYTLDISKLPQPPTTGGGGR